MANRKLYFLAVASVLFVLVCQSVLTDAQCTQGDVRLTSKSVTSSYVTGTIQICSLGQWGTICAPSGYINFGSSEAKVICRQLGYSDRGAVYRNDAYYGQGSGSVLLTRGLDCTGNERRWLDCDLQQTSNVYTCSSNYHYYDAGVQCIQEPEVSITISPPFVGLDSPPYEHFTLWCNVSSSEQLDVQIITTWYKDGVIISESESMVIQTSMLGCFSSNCSALIINDAVTSYSGEYMCSATVIMPDSRIVASNATTSVVIHATTEAIVQLHFTGVHHCKDWVFIEAHEKATDIDELLSQAIQEKCDCSFSLDRLVDSGLVCTDNLDEIVYQSRILATPLANSSTLIQHITQLINTPDYQTFVVRGLRLKVVPDCPVLIDSFLDTACGVQVSSTSSSLSSTSSTSNASILAITEGIVIIVVVAIAVVLCIVSCLLCVVLRKRKSGQFIRMTEESNVSYEREAGVSISGGRHFRPIVASNQAADDVYEELPLKPDQDEKY